MESDIEWNNSSLGDGEQWVESLADYPPKLGAAVSAIHGVEGEEGWVIDTILKVIDLTSLAQEIDKKFTELE